MCNTQKAAPQAAVTSAKSVSNSKITNATVNFIDITEIHENLHLSLQDIKKATNFVMIVILVVIAFVVLYFLSKFVKRIFVNYVQRKVNNELRVLSQDHLNRI
jgi:hypothetical protein